MSALVGPLGADSTLADAAEGTRLLLAVAVVASEASEAELDERRDSGRDEPTPCAGVHGRDGGERGGECRGERSGGEDGEVPIDESTEVRRAASSLSPATLDGPAALVPLAEARLDCAGGGAKTHTVPSSQPATTLRSPRPPSCSPAAPAPLLSAPALALLAAARPTRPTAMAVTRPLVSRIHPGRSRSSPRPGRCASPCGSMTACESESAVWKGACASGEALLRDEAEGSSGGGRAGPGSTADAARSSSPSGAQVPAARSRSSKMSCAAEGEEDAADEDEGGAGPLSSSRESTTAKGWAD